MKIKVAATSLESAGIRSSPTAATVARTAIVVVLLAVDMFAVKLATAQQVAFKAGRVPRIYNALITSDQRLLPSQADPIVTPVFRPFPFFYNGWPEVYAAEVPAPVSPSRLAQKPAGEVAAAASAVVSEVSTPEVVGSTRARDDGGDPASVAVVKNNKPADTSVPDVPPPPLPVSRAGAAAGKKKKPEEFPPPPVSFAI